MKYFLPRLLNKINLLNKVNLNQTSTIYGKRVKIPIINKIGFDNLFLGELWMIPLIEKLISIKKGTFIDIGVNIGQTLLKLKSIDSEIEYIGFEPNPMCVFYVRKLIKVNKYKNCKIVPVGISNENKLLELNFYYNNETDSSASIIKDFRPEQKIAHELYVPVYDFRSLKNALIPNNISIVKIDVEGAELEVLDGMKETILEHQPFIICEILPVYSNENSFRKARQEKIEKMLTDMDYVIYRIEKFANNKTYNLLEINEIGIHSDLGWCDYLFMPAKLKDNVLNLT